MPRRTLKEKGSPKTRAVVNAKKTTDTKTPAPAVSVPVVEQVGEVPQLTLADVKNAVNVIDLAANQGAFRGWEVISQFMQVRQRLAAFVEAASPKTEGEEAAVADDGKAQEAVNG